MVRIYLAGRVVLEVGESALCGRSLGGGQATALLAMLVAERHRSVSADELVDHLWGESPPAAWSQALRSLISKLRSRLAVAGPGDPIVSWMGCYQLRLPRSSWVDIECARTSIHEAEAELAAGRPRKACGLALVAASISRDQFLPGWWSEWTEIRRRELGEVRLRALECLAEVWLDQGSPAMAVRDAAEVVRRAPLREPAYRQLIRAHAAARSHAEAVSAYEALRTILADQLDARPSPETAATLRRALSG